MNPLRPLVHWSVVIPFGVWPAACVIYEVSLPIAFAGGVIFGAVWAGWRLTA